MELDRTRQIILKLGQFNSETQVLRVRRSGDGDLPWTFQVVDKGLSAGRAMGRQLDRTNPADVAQGILELIQAPGLPDALAVNPLLGRALFHLKIELLKLDRFRFENVESAIDGVVPDYDPSYVVVTERFPLWAGYEGAKDPDAFKRFVYAHLELLTSQGMAHPDANQVVSFLFTKYTTFSQAADPADIARDYYTLCTDTRYRPTEPHIRRCANLAQIDTFQQVYLTQDSPIGQRYRSDPIFRICVDSHLDALRRNDTVLNCEPRALVGGLQTQFRAVAASYLATPTHPLDQRIATKLSHFLAKEGATDPKGVLDFVAANKAVLLHLEHDTDFPTTTEQLQFMMKHDRAFAQINSFNGVYDAAYTVAQGSSPTANYLRQRAQARLIGLFQADLTDEPHGYTDLAALQRRYQSSSIVQIQIDGILLKMQEDPRADLWTTQELIQHLQNVCQVVESAQRLLRFGPLVATSLQQIIEYGLQEKDNIRRVEAFLTAHHAKLGPLEALAASVEAGRALISLVDSFGPSIVLPIDLDKLNRLGARLWKDAQGDTEGKHAERAILKEIVFEPFLQRYKARFAGSFLSMTFGFAVTGLPDKADKYVKATAIHGEIDRWAQSDTFVDEAFAPVGTLGFWEKAFTRLDRKLIPFIQVEVSQQRARKYARDFLLINSSTKPYNPNTMLAQGRRLMDPTRPHHREELSDNPEIGREVFTEMMVTAYVAYLRAGNYSELLHKHKSSLFNESYRTIHDLVPLKEVMGVVGKSTQPQVTDFFLRPVEKGQNECYHIDQAVMAYVRAKLPERMLQSWKDRFKTPAQIAKLLSIHIRVDDLQKYIDVGEIHAAIDQWLASGKINGIPLAEALTSQSQYGTGSTLISCHIAALVKAKIDTIN